MTKPLIKWVGGKSQIIEQVIQKFPYKINNYHEPFLGGGSVLLALLDNIENNKIQVSGKIIAYDSNWQLISMFQNIRDNHEYLFELLSYYINLFNNVEDKENFYYEMRDKYNILSNEYNVNMHNKINLVELSAIFIFLNKTCFRGLYRVGPNGFNVPYGNYKSPEIINKNHLDRIHFLIRNVNFIVSDFIDAIKIPDLKTDDFIYMDPPYFPEDVKSFTKYTINGFNTQQHIELFNMIHEITKKRKKVLLSNSDTEFVKKSFEGYFITIINCKRRINSKNPQATTNELLITNYQ